MREIFVTELVKEALGPRNGIRETITSNPLNEYITGVLVPATNATSMHSEVKDTIDNEAEIPADYQGNEEALDEDVAVSPFLDPALNPKERPSTMGISFEIHSAKVPRIKLCVTGAWYEKVSQNQDSWRRNPICSILEVALAEQNKRFWLDRTGKVVENQSEASLRIDVMTRRNIKKENNYFVSIYLVNSIPITDDEGYRTEQCVFQPQIRIACMPDTTIRDLSTIDYNENSELEYLYRDKRVLAKGHLCSAVWKDIDPESIPEGARLDFNDCINSVPFAWQDSELLQENERKIFKVPDLRTEFIPMFSISFPKLDWRSEYGNEPELVADNIAETWDPNTLRDMLLPLADGYEKWLGALQDRKDGENSGALSGKLVNNAREVLGRIRDGISILLEDEDARLSFCFANKAIATQHNWHDTSGRKFKWFPFQLAFILLNIEPIVNSKSRYRDRCDLLWVPTGAGKTEAYLGVLVFTIAYRRRRNMIASTGDKTGAGTSVITRYTLRLLSIQQFRRIVGLITACEFLRVYDTEKGGSIGWRPGKTELKGNLLWGSTQLGAGLWVGGGVTPNSLQGTGESENYVPGALAILSGYHSETSEPAQIITCPACATILSIPEGGLDQNKADIYLTIYFDGSDIDKKANAISGKSYLHINITKSELGRLASNNYYTLKLTIASNKRIESKEINDMWYKYLFGELKAHGVDVRLCCASASRPGYFIRSYTTNRGTPHQYDFEIFCPNLNCPLHVAWFAGTPTGSVCSDRLGSSSDAIPRTLADGNKQVHIQTQFRLGSAFMADRVPIPACTVDDQIYSKAPAVIVATVDKFARPPFEPRASAIFGNVDQHHAIYGYFRGEPQGLKGRGEAKNYTDIRPLNPPDLILQDELHLIEGPLGSLVGMYETAVDFLCTRGDVKPKYIASTATISRAKEQVASIFSRDLQVFPCLGLDAGDRFFIKDEELHPLRDERPGRLYIGICSPGRGPHTPVIRIWSRLLQTAEQYKNTDPSKIDRFWTLTGYFNSIRELAGVRALYRQDIQQRITETGNSGRQIPEENVVELSGRTSSTDLPPILDRLDMEYPMAADALFTTSMFGTGVDIQRIGLMVVNGQPKTTSEYIQATGRVGRRKGAVVVTFFRASRPRDLSHYELFCGYHQQLHRFVEPVTVYPFAPSVIERTAGPVGVFMLRNMNGSVNWYEPISAPTMAQNRTSAGEIKDIVMAMERRAAEQPEIRRPQAGYVNRIMNSKLDDWEDVASRDTNLVYSEYSVGRPPTKKVVLGDSLHQYKGLEVVYERVPQSLRDIEDTTGFQV